MFNLIPATKEEAQLLADALYDEAQNLWSNSERARIRDCGGHYGACATCEQQWTQVLINSGVCKMDRLAKSLPSIKALTNVNAEPDEEEVW